MIDLEDWGKIDYEPAAERQLALVSEVAAGSREDTIVFCTHPPVVTLGRSSAPEDVQGWKGPVVEVSRGGKATYHGPNQLVVYPIISLLKERENLKVRDVHAYLRALETAIVQTLKIWGVEAEARTQAAYNERGEKLQVTGVWVGERKIASIGIAVKKWVTYHGAAINLDQDSNAFLGINPCGFRKETMVSLEEVISRKVDHASFRDLLFANLNALLS